MLLRQLDIASVTKYCIKATRKSTIRFLLIMDCDKKSFLIIDWAFVFILESLI